ncbi:hypothetical protein [Actinophytocola sediminis]
MCVGPHQTEASSDIWTPHWTIDQPDEYGVDADNQFDDSARGGEIPRQRLLAELLAEPVDPIRRWL